MPLLGYFCPDIEASHVTKVRPAFLAERGIRLVLVDLDNTLIGKGTFELDQSVIDWAWSLAKFSIKLRIVSNASRRRIEWVAGQLDCQLTPCDWGKGLFKPLPAIFRSALNGELNRKQVAMIGDQRLTDVWGARLAGLGLVILVQPLSNKDYIGTRYVNRNLERLIARIQKRLPNPPYILE